MILVDLVGVAAASKSLMENDLVYEGDVDLGEASMLCSTLSLLR